MTISKTIYTIAALLSAVAILLPATSAAQSSYDQNEPFGFCTRSSRTSSTAVYNITGGGCYTYPIPASVASSKVTTLTATGKDMKSAIQNAITNYSVIIFDGSKGDFLVSSTISLSKLSGKTLIGINNARICTTWYATEEIINALNEAGVPGMSTSSGTGGTLTNGSSVSEQAEYMTRQIIINKTGDTRESYRSSGIFYFSSCSNLIIRNLKFVGPGSIDVSGSDLISFYGTTNSWVDHCEFTDGMDGNFDITQKANYITVSWCTFSYTDRSYMHQNTNLVGSSDSETTGYLNTTFAFNKWGEKCRARMPMARVGKIHMLNNYYDCGGNASPCINPRKNSEFLIEGNYFAKNVYNYFSQTDAVAYVWNSNNYIGCGGSKPSSKGTVTVPYTYTVATTSEIPQAVGTYAGATLFGNKEKDPNYKDDTSDNDQKDEDDSSTESSSFSGNTYKVSADESATDGKQIKCTSITMTYGTNASWNASATPMPGAIDGYDYYFSGQTNTSFNNNIPFSGVYYVFTPTKDGKLTVAMSLYTNKVMYLTEQSSTTTKAVSFIANGKCGTYTDGKLNVSSTLTNKSFAANANGITLNSASQFYGTITFDVKAGCSYYLSGKSTKVMLYGFSFIPTPLPGDANEDGTVSISDANLVVNHYLGNNTAYINETNADINNDKTIDISDANDIVNKYTSK